MNGYYVVIGLLLGCFFGYVVQVSNFCFVQSLKEIKKQQNYNKLYSFILAIAVAVLCMQLILSFIGFSIENIIARTPSISFLGATIGGFIFGCGLAFSDGCVYKQCAFLARGKLDRICVLVPMAFVVYFTSMHENSFISLLSSSESTIASHISIVSLAHEYIGGKLSYVQFFIGLFIFLCLCIVVFSSSHFRKSTLDIFAGICVGLIVVLGWIVTWEYNKDAMVTLGFIVPISNILSLLLTPSETIFSFGSAVLIGIFVGSFLENCIHKKHKISYIFINKGTFRLIIGGVLMGYGGVTAFGCTIGQGIIGVSILTFSSLLTFTCMFCGCFLMIKIFNFYQMK